MGLTVKVLQTPPLSPATALPVYQQTKVKSRSTKLHKENRKPVWHVLPWARETPPPFSHQPHIRRPQACQPSPLTTSQHQDRALFTSQQSLNQHTGDWSSITSTYPSTSEHQSPFLTKISINKQRGKLHLDQVSICFDTKRLKNYLWSFWHLCKNLSPFWIEPHTRVLAPKFQFMV